MKLSQYARKEGISYRTALRWWQAGLIPGYQAATGTIIVTGAQARPEEKPEELVAVYARVSSHEHRANLQQQAKRLEDYCVAKGYRVQTVVREVGSGVNDREDVLHDLVWVMYSFAARLYGRRLAKRKTAAIVAQLKQEATDATGRATSDPQN